MKNAFLPTQVHYAFSPEHKNAVQVAENHKYESLLFHPSQTEKVYMLYETENDFRVLSIEYDPCTDRFHPSESDELHIFENRKTAFRYLDKRTNALRTE